MTSIRIALAGIMMIVIALVLNASPSDAGQTNLCVSCSGPQKTYVCQVETPDGNPGDKALQLYCIVKTAKQGKHSACSVRRDTVAPCDGQLVSYVYDGPMIPQALRTEIRKDPPPVSGDDTTVLSGPPTQKGGEPETLVEMTGPAIHAGKSAARTTGKAVRGAASSTGHAIGTVSKKAGRGVGNTARSAGAAARDAGSAMGKAAHYTYNCLKSLFRNCSGSQSE